MGIFQNTDREVMRVFEIREHHSKIVNLAGMSISSRKNSLTFTHVVDIMESHLTCIDAFGI